MRRYLRNVLFLCLLAVLTFGVRTVTCNAAKSTARSYERTYMRGFQSANGGREFDVYGRLVYEVLSDGTIRITSCDENAQGTIEVPDSINGKKVTSIGDEAFRDCIIVEEIKLPESITDIGKGAFTACWNLKSVNIPEGIKVIKDATFFACTNLTHLTLPESVTEIESKAFYNCEKLMNINIPERVTSIGDSAFNMCKSLGTADLPENLKSLGVYAFASCENLNHIKIPKGLKVIGECTFNNCYHLNDVKFSEGLKTMKSEAFGQCSELKNIILPESLESIGWFAFGGAGLQSVVIPKNVNYIGEYAFKGDSLTNISILNSECSIEDSAYTIEKKAVISGHAGSTAQSYAEKYNRKFKSLGGVCSHQFKKSLIKATPYKNGCTSTVCRFCGLVKGKETIYQSNRISLPVTNYVYDGKTKTPSVYVKDSKGRTLKKNVDYRLIYSSGRKNIQRYTVTISFCGNYSGTLKRTFTISPQRMKIYKITAKTKGFLVKWKKNRQSSGYQVQYSSNSKFKKAKTLTVRKSSATSKKVSKLRRRKKYYIRVRTYKIVKVNGKNTNIYGKWSPLKHIKTK